MKKQIKDLPASVRRRLLDKSRVTVRPFNEILQFYSMERFLYRCATSPHAGKLVLKGGLLLAAWKTPLSRPTKDIDFLGRMDSSIEAIVAMVKDICRQEVEPDGMDFDGRSVRGERIVEDAEYEGVRVHVEASLGKAQVPLRMDFGFGDVVFPSATMLSYPTILDFPAPRLRAYTKESMIAEKLEAMLLLGMVNSRMKDFHDIWLLSRQFAFSGETLATAISRTLAHRGVKPQPRPVALTGTFAQDPMKRTQWTAFIRKSRLDHAPEDLKEVVDALSSFLEPVIAALALDRPFSKHWTAGGEWG